MCDLAEQMAEQLDTDLKAALADAEFGYPEHDPQWLPAGSAQVCAVCGVVDFPGKMLPTGVVYRGGPALDDSDEELYRQEKWS